MWTFYRPFEKGSSRWTYRPFYQQQQQQSQIRALYSQRSESANDITHRTPIKKPCTETAIFFGLANYSHTDWRCRAPLNRNLLFLIACVRCNVHSVYKKDTKQKVFSAFLSFSVPKIHSHDLLLLLLAKLPFHSLRVHQWASLSQGCSKFLN